MRQFPLLLAVVLAGGGCERRTVSPPEDGGQVSQTPASPSSRAEPDPYAAYDFPPVHDAWGPSEYANFRDTLVEIERQQPELLVTFAGPKGAVLAHFVSLEALAEAIARTEDLDAMFEISDALAQVYKLYAVRVQRQRFGPEYLALAAAALRLGSLQFARVTEQFDEATLRAEPVRRGGMLKMRYGLVTIFIGALQLATSQPAIVEPGLAVAQLGSIAADVAPFLLADERRLVNALLTQLLMTGADAAQVAEIGAAVAGSSMHPLIATFRAESQAFSDERRQLEAQAIEQQVAPVERGAEPGGVRYAFPDAGFSAVFHQRPNAMLMTSAATDGVTITIRTLGIRDATGYATTIICVSRPEPYETDDARSLARRLIEGAQASDVREVDVGGRPGFEGAVSTAQSRGLIRTMEVDNHGCTIIAEYPARLADSYEEQARAFLRSFELTGESQGHGRG